MDEFPTCSASLTLPQAPLLACMHKSLLPLSLLSTLMLGNFMLTIWDGGISRHVSRVCSGLSVGRDNCDCSHSFTEGCCSAGPGLDTVTEFVCMFSGAGSSTNPQLPPFSTAIIWGPFHAWQTLS